MLGLIERTGTDFGISVIMSSHLLGEIESVCDSLVLIEEGKLTRVGAVAQFTGLGNVLAVEVGRDPELLVSRIIAHDVNAWVDGRIIEVEMPDESATAEAALMRLVVDSVVDLGLPLVRVARQRHTLRDMFRNDDPRASGNEEAV
jgi:ABC-2 type transport system ATP-binding protein